MYGYTAGSRMDLINLFQVLRVGPFKFDQILEIKLIRPLKHHLVELARTLILSCHLLRSCIKFGRSSGKHPVSLLIWSIYMMAGCPTRVWPWRGVQSRRSLASSCFSRQQCPAKRILRSNRIFEMSGMGP